MGAHEENWICLRRVSRYMSERDSRPQRRLAFSTQQQQQQQQQQKQQQPRGIAAAAAAGG
ncbi:hypothetical protein Emag_001095 [Eimeria magna]